MRFDIVTIFPGFFAGIFEHGVVKRGPRRLCWNRGRARSAAIHP